ncbi:hypothetical protein AWH49_05525 [Domibacillus aminovorans]|uniref:Core-binding (CB) domain-containing protein n=1 Tax=Domibacillus aminovorans TaxID=29332 RepID=A0A177KXX9_9BACI|nr:hypothetical protein AWH49_05525 [Domibacillus aminovorans]
MFNEIDFQVDNIMLYCDSKNLTRKMKASYGQSLRLFIAYLRDYHSVDEPKSIKTATYALIYSIYVSAESIPSLRINNPKQLITRMCVPISDTTIANYLRNIRVF